MESLGIKVTNRVKCATTCGATAYTQNNLPAEINVVLYKKKNMKLKKV